MRSYELDLRMDPVQWSPCTLTLVKNVGSFLGVNVDTLTGDNRERPAGVNLRRYRCNVIPKRAEELVLNMNTRVLVFWLRISTLLSSHLYGS